MPISHQFDYQKVEKLDQALKLLNDFGAKAKVIAGGTDIVVQLKEDVSKPEMLIDLKDLNELNKIEFSDNILRIGANVTFSDLEHSDIIKEKFYILWESAGTVASIGVRNRATLTGNICSAVPSLDSAPALFVYDAEVIVKSVESERKIKIQDWFVAPKRTALKPNELVIALILHLPKEKSFGCYKKLGRYQGEDLAQAGVGILAIENKEYRVAFCAVGPIPKRAFSIEKLLSGKSISAELISEAQKLVEQEISPITDIRASKEYRTELVKVMLERGLQDAVKVLNCEKINFNPII